MQQKERRLTCRSGLSASGIWGDSAPNAALAVWIVRRSGETTSRSAAVCAFPAASASASIGLWRSLALILAPRSVKFGSRSAWPSSCLPCVSSTLCSASPCRTIHTVFTPSAAIAAAARGGAYGPIAPSDSLTHPRPPTHSAGTFAARVRTAV